MLHYYDIPFIILERNEELEKGDSHAKRDIKTGKRRLFKSDV